MATNTARKRKTGKPKRKPLARAKTASVPTKTGAETRQAARHSLIKAITNTSTKNSGGSAFAIDMFTAAEDWPEDFRAVMKRLAASGLQFAQLVEAGSESTKHTAKVVQAYRQRIIAEMEITSIAEFMLLDAAMDAYLHWLDLTRLTRAAYRDGTDGNLITFQPRVAGMAQSYLRTFMEAMKGLMEVKRPPVQVLKVQVGQTVAVQVNENALKPLSDGKPEVLIDAERTNILESTPANATAASTDHG